MIESLPEPLPPAASDPPAAAPEGAGLRWGPRDIIVFGVFFGLTIVFLPAFLFMIVRMFRPEMQVTNVPAVIQVVFQAVMDLVLVGFIAFLVKVVHHASFFQAIHWFEDHTFGTGFLIALGATLAVSVLIVSNMFPPTNPPPIEKLMSSDIGSYGFWWSSSENSADTFNPWYRLLNTNNANLYRYSWNKRVGYSVRCLKD